jgi:hypothetical protein
MSRLSGLPIELRTAWAEAIATPGGVIELSGPDIAQLLEALSIDLLDLRAENAKLLAVVEAAENVYAADHASDPAEFIPALHALYDALGKPQVGGV